MIQGASVGGAFFVLEIKKYRTFFGLSILYITKCNGVSGYRLFSKEPWTQVTENTWGKGIGNYANVLREGCFFVNNGERYGNHRRIDGADISVLL